MSAPPRPSATTTGASSPTATSGPGDIGPGRLSRLRRLRRRVRQALVALLALALVGTGIQVFAERRYAASHPAPGEHVELGDGRRIHLQVAGEHHDGPTVVLLAGAGGSVSAWGWVLPAVAEHARAVAYDRAGLGWSDRSDADVTADTVIDDLRETLAARDLPGPYVLVGHSIGGHHARAFAAAHPDEVGGIVLVDPSHEHQAEALDMDSASAGRMLTAVRVATQIGLTRLYLPAAFTADLQPLPQPQRDQALGQMRTVGYWRTFGSEMVSLDAIGAMLPTGAGALGDLPVHVLIATGGATTDAQRQQIEIATALRSTMDQMSSAARTTVLPDASHVSIVTDQRHADVITDAIVEIVEGLR
jgi:pimeloyl-ACP methyl ester carboxylesterase